MAKTVSYHDEGAASKAAMQEEKVRRVEITISYVLRIGVILSVLILCAGLGLIFAHHPEYASKLPYNKVVGLQGNFPHSFGSLINSVSKGEGSGIAVLGLAILILTPIMRVAVSILAFIYQRDPAMTLVTSFVLAALLFSLFIR
jgi:uncharacterized membrane protein